MLKREAEDTLRFLLKKTPVVALTGPRQSGKTTLARGLFPQKPFISLEDPQSRSDCRDDPRSFLDNFPKGGIIDEVQRCPELLPFLRNRVEAEGRPGLFILTGSQKNRLLSRLHQELSDRVAGLELLPLSLREKAHFGEKPKNIDRTLLSGAFPALHRRVGTCRAWFGDYMAAYLERDVRQVLKVHELEVFQHFVRLCAGRTGQLLNYSALAADCGITHNTAKAWISVLEDGYMVFRLYPHQSHFKKRLVRVSKLYFYDTGLVSWLLGIKTPEQMENHPLRGGIFETFVISELMKSYCNRGKAPGFYFWRDSNGLEVDLLIKEKDRIQPLEIRPGKTVNRQFFTALEKWTDLAGDLASDPVLIFGGAENSVHNKVRVMGWQAGLTNWGQMKAA
ncbi:MAG: ATP-binding protein [Thermodesulfobacteriota bacterium]